MSDPFQAILNVYFMLSFILRCRSDFPVLSLVWILYTTEFVIIVFYNQYWFDKFVKFCWDNHVDPQTVFLNKRMKLVYQINIYTVIFAVNIIDDIAIKYLYVYFL